MFYSTSYLRRSPRESDTTLAPETVVLGHRIPWDPDKAINFIYTDNVYQVKTSHGVLIQSQESGCQYVATDGLISCIALAVVDPFSKTGIMIHFYSAEQVRKCMQQIHAEFMRACPSFEENPRALHATVAGGSVHFSESEKTLAEILTYVHKTLAPTPGVLNIKMQMLAPLQLETEKDHVAIAINLHTGSTQAMLGTPKRTCAPPSHESIFLRDEEQCHKIAWTARPAQGLRAPTLLYPDHIRAPKKHSALQKKLRP